MAPATKKRRRINSNNVTTSAVSEMRDYGECAGCNDNSSSTSIVCELNQWQGIRVGTNCTNNKKILVSKQRIRQKGVPSYKSFRSTTYFLLRLSWPYLSLLFMLLLTLTLLIFAGLLYACEAHVDNSISFYQSIDLSIHTLSTIGYGSLAPESACGNWVVVVEAFVAIFFVAFCTGIAFAKFAKPKATLRFSDVFTIGSTKESPTALAMFFRVVNASRAASPLQNEIYDAGFRVTLIRVEKNRSGKRVLCSYNLPLVQTNFLSLRLAVNLVHVIDSHSPFANMNQSDIEASDFQINIVLSGIDSTLHDTIHEQRTYVSTDLVWGAKFEPMVKWVRNKIKVDYSKISKTIEDGLVNELGLVTMDRDAVAHHPPLSQIFSSKKSINASSSSSLLHHHNRKSVRSGMTTSLDPLHSMMTEGGMERNKNNNNGATNNKFKGKWKQFLETARASHGLSHYVDLEDNTLAEEILETERKNGDGGAAVTAVVIEHQNYPSWFPFGSSSTLYYKSLETSWITLLLVITSVYFVVNATFALLAMARSGSIVNFASQSMATGGDTFFSEFQTGFFFSVQTLSSIGYGRLNPNPESPVINFIVFVEAIIGVIGATLFTGITWAKFSIPENVSIRFSDRVLVTTFHGKRCLMIRAGNSRTHGDIIESSFRLAVVKSSSGTNSRTAGGEHRELQELELLQDVFPVFQLCATVIHFIDEHSPLYNMSSTDIIDDHLTLVVLFSGLDTTLEEHVYARKTYRPYDWVFPGDLYQFRPNVDITETETIVDFSKLNDIVRTEI